MKREGIRTLVRKLRLCQSARGRNRTRVERFAVAPSPDAWRMILRRLLFGKRIGTFAKAYRVAPAKQNLLRSCFWVVFGEGKEVRDNAIMTLLRRASVAPDSAS